MKKLAIIKTISLLLGLGIIFCIFVILLQLLGANQKHNEKTLTVPIASETVIRDYKVSRNKIYIWTTSGDQNEIIIIDERSGKKIKTIKLIEGER